MKKTLMMGGLIAAMLVPAMAQAQTREIREERRELREERREYRDAKRDYRGEVREWQRDRRYSNYRAPFAYRPFAVGVTLRPQYYGPSYRLGWDHRWGLPRAGRNLTYVRHYNDLLLVNARSGRVVRVYRNHFRWR